MYALNSIKFFVQEARQQFQLCKLGWWWGLGEKSTEVEGTITIKGCLFWVLFFESALFPSEKDLQVVWRQLVCLQTQIHLVKCYTVRNLAQNRFTFTFSTADSFWWKRNAAVGCKSWICWQWHMWCNEREMLSSAKRLLLRYFSKYFCSTIFKNKIRMFVLANEFSGCFVFCLVDQVSWTRLNQSKSSICHCKNSPVFISTKNFIGQSFSEFFLPGNNHNFSFW